jgi:hypothetical protein
VLAGVRLHGKTDRGKTILRPSTNNPAALRRAAPEGSPAKRVNGLFVEGRTDSRAAGASVAARQH